MKFSEREGFAPQEQPLQYSEVPGWVREAFVNLVGSSVAEFAEASDGPTANVFANALYSHLKPEIWKVLKGEPPKSPMFGPWSKYIPELFKFCEWWQFYDLCEEIHRFIETKYGDDNAEIVAQKTNELFSNEGIVWRFKDGLIVRAMADPLSRKIEEAHVLLGEARFQGPDTQFRKALAHLNRRPEPDLENAIKDAVGALEGVARIITNRPKDTLSEILPSLSGARIPKPLYKAFESVYAYRSDLPGAGHGQVGPSSVGISEAEFVISLCAAMIIYLAR